MTELTDFLSVRNNLYDYFHANQACQTHFFNPASQDDYATYYTSMYLLADTAEALYAHRQRGFSSDPLIAYIEFWGVMQAVTIQQDTLVELHRVLCGPKPDRSTMEFWQKIREIRHQCAGHPAKKDQPRGSKVLRTFMGRGPKDYKSIMFEQYTEGEETTHVRFDLGAMIDRYSGDALKVLKNAFDCMRERWPMNPP